MILLKVVQGGGDGDGDDEDVVGDLHQLALAHYLFVGQFDQRR